MYYCMHSYGMYAHNSDSISGLWQLVALEVNRIKVHAHLFSLRLKCRYTYNIMYDNIMCHV